MQPTGYQTNDYKLTAKGASFLGLGQASEEELQPSLQCLKELLSWIIPQLEAKQDFNSAARAALLHRHLFKDPSTPFFDISPFFIQKLNDRFKTKTYVYDGLDQLDNQVQSAIDKLSSAAKQAIL